MSEMLVWFGAGWLAMGISTALFVAAIAPKGINQSELLVAMIGLTFLYWPWTLFTIWKFKLWRKP